MTTSLPRLFVIEDEPEIRNLLETALASDYHVKSAANAKDGLKLLSRHPPDVVLLDLGLPDMDGKAVIAEIRAFSSLPIIILSARSAESEKVSALEAGADDYITKPFGLTELRARIKVALRHANRTGTVDDAVYKSQDLKVDLTARRVTREGHAIALTPTEYALLACLVRKAGHIVTQSELLHDVWGKGGAENKHYLRIYIQHLRKKLGDDPISPRYIFTDPGIGYRLISNEEP